MEKVTQLHMYFSPLVQDRGLRKFSDQKTAASCPESLPSSWFIITLWRFSISSIFATSSLQEHSIMTSRKWKMIFFPLPLFLPTEFFYHEDDWLICLNLGPQKSWRTTKDQVVKPVTSGGCNNPPLHDKEVQGKILLSFTHWNEKHECLLLIISF